MTLKAEKDLSAPEKKSDLFGVWKFHDPLIRHLPRVLFSAGERFTTWLTILLFFLTLVNKKLGEWVITGYAGLSPWWSLVPLGFLALHGLLKSNRERFLTIQAKCDHLTRELRQANELQEKGESLPEIELTIKEGFINPVPEGVANCFFNLLLRNSTQLRCSNPDDYSLFLTIAGKPYSKNTFLDLSGYYLSHYKEEIMYDDDGHAFEGEREINREDLLDIRKKPGELTRGSPITGWVGFAAYGLPPWPVWEEVIGQHSEMCQNEDEQYGEEIWVDDIKRTPHTRNIQTVTLAVVDAYGQSHEATLSAPFESHGKRIVKDHLHRLGGYG